MAIAARAAGSWAVISGSSGTINVPAGSQVGDRRFLFLAYKDQSRFTTEVTGSWLSAGDFSDGTVSSGASTGSVRVVALYQDVTADNVGQTVVNVTFDGTVIALGVVVVFSKAAGETWTSVPSVVSAAISPAASSFEETASSNVAVPDGALVLAVVGIRDDSSTFTRSAFGSQQGIDSGVNEVTWNGNYVEYPTTHGSTSSGNDLAADLGYRLVTTGHASTDLTATGTLSASETGSILWLVQGVTSDTGPQTVTASLLTQLGALVTPALRGAVAASLIDQPAAVVAPTAQHRVSLDLITYLAAPQPPDVSVQPRIEASLIAQSAAPVAPALKHLISAPLIGGAAVDHARSSEGTTVTANTVWLAAANAIDGNDATLWESNGPTGGVWWLRADFGSAKTVSSYRVLLSGQTPANLYLARDWELQSSDDGTNWTARHAVSGNSTRDPGEVTLSSPTTARYWRFYVTAVNQGSDVDVHTLSLFGAAAGATAIAPSLRPSIGVGLLAQAGQPVAPSVRHRVVTEPITRLAAPVAPAIAHRVSAGLVTQPAGVVAPTATQRVNVGLLTQLGAPIAPSFSVAGQTVTVGLIAQPAAVAAPVARNGVSVPLLAQTAAVIAPQARGALTAPLIAQTAAVVAPVAVQRVVAGLISQPAAVIAPSVGSRLGPQLISQPAGVTAPTARGRVSLDTISYLGQPISPFVGESLTVVAGTISSPATAIVPSLKVVVALPLLSAAGDVVQPAIHSQMVMGVISSPASVLTPYTRPSIDLPVIDATAIVLDPEVSVLTAQSIHIFGATHPRGWAASHSSGGESRVGPGPGAAQSALGRTRRLW